VPDGLLCDVGSNTLVESSCPTCRPDDANFCNYVCLDVSVNGLPDYAAGSPDALLPLRRAISGILTGSTGVAVGVGDVSATATVVGSTQQPDGSGRRRRQRRLSLKRGRSQMDEEVQEAADVRTGAVAMQASGEVQLNGMSDAPWVRRLAADRSLAQQSWNPYAAASTADDSGAPATDPLPDVPVVDLQSAVGALGVGASSLTLKVKVPVSADGVDASQALLGALQAAVSGPADTSTATMSLASEGYPYVVQAPAGAYLLEAAKAAPSPAPGAVSGGGTVSGQSTSGGTASAGSTSGLSTNMILIIAGSAVGGLLVLAVIGAVVVMKHPGISAWGAQRMRGRSTQGPSSRPGPMPGGMAVMVGTAGDRGSPFDNIGPDTSAAHFRSPPNVRRQSARPPGTGAAAGAPNQPVSAYFDPSRHALTHTSGRPQRQSLQGPVTLAIGTAATTARPLLGRSASMPVLPQLPPAEQPRVTPSGTLSARQAPFSGSGGLAGGAAQQAARGGAPHRATVSLPLALPAPPPSTRSDGTARSGAASFSSGGVSLGALGSGIVLVPARGTAAGSSLTRSSAAPSSGTSRASSAARASGASDSSGAREVHDREDEVSVPEPVQQRGRAGSRARSRSGSRSRVTFSGISPDSGSSAVGRDRTHVGAGAGRGRRPPNLPVIVSAETLSDDAADDPVISDAGRRTGAVAAGRRALPAAAQAGPRARGSAAPSASGLIAVDGGVLLSAGAHSAGMQRRQSAPGTVARRAGPAELDPTPQRRAGDGRRA
jgi:hypothetical protein